MIHIFDSLSFFAFLEATLLWFLHVFCKIIKKYIYLYVYINNM